MEHLYSSSSILISEKIGHLTILRSILADFLGRIYMAATSFGDETVDAKVEISPLDSLKGRINDIFTRLEERIQNLIPSRQLIFAKLLEDSPWCDCKRMIYENIDLLQCYLAEIVLRHGQPRGLTLHWIKYVFGLPGICSFSVLLLRLFGRFGMGKCISNAMNLCKNKVVQPIGAIKDEILSTTQNTLIDPEHVKLSTEYLQSMMLKLHEKTHGKRTLESASARSLHELVMKKYAMGIKRPILGLMYGDTGQCLLIQIQQLKVLAEKGVLTFDQILNAQRLSLAVLAALPALGVCSITLIVIWTLIKSRLAEVPPMHDERKLMLAQVKRLLKDFKRYTEAGQGTEVIYGLLIYHLDFLYRVAKRYAKSKGELICTRQWIVELVDPRLHIDRKLSTLEQLVQLM